METTEKVINLEFVVSYERGENLLCLLCSLFLSICTVIVFGFPDSEAANFVRKYFDVLLGAVVALGILNMSALLRTTNLRAFHPLRKAAHADELYQLSLKRACKHGFIFALILQVIFAISLTVWTIPQPHLFVTCLTFFLSLALFLVACFILIGIPYES